MKEWTYKGKRGGISFLFDIILNDDVCMYVCQYKYIRLGKALHTYTDSTYLLCFNFVFVIRCKN